MGVSDFPQAVLARLRGRPAGARPRDVDPAHAARAERQERAVRWALRLRDPLRLCGLGWHRTPSGMWFRIGTAANPDKLIVYRVGSEPFDRVCTTVWNHTGKPVICSVCSTPGYEWSGSRPVTGDAPHPE